MDIVISVFLMGLLGGAHCLGMCGGVVGILSANIHSDASNKLATYHLNYNIGRILSYVLMGMIFGLVGTLLAQTLHMSLFDKLLRILSGFLMVFVGLYIASWSSKIQILEKIGSKLWVKLQPLTKRFIPVRNAKSAFFVGLLWGGIPCGLVYGALSFAMLSGNIADGAIIMLAFGLGTLPSLLLMASMADKLASVIQRPLVRKLSGIIIIILGLSAMFMPIKSLLSGNMSGHNMQHSEQFTKPGDFDYLT